MAVMISDEPPSDEVLVAYADRRLDFEFMKAVEHKLEADPKSRKFVEDLRMSAAVLRLAFDHILISSPSQRLQQMIVHAGTGKVGFLRPHATRKMPRHYEWYSPWQVAAGLLCAIFANASFQASIGTRPGDAHRYSVAMGLVSPISKLHFLLETKPSHEPVATSVGDSAAAYDLTIVETFADRQGQPCREFEYASLASPGTIEGLAIACRRRDGWSVVHIQTSQPLSHDQLSNIVPSSGNHALAEGEALSKLRAGRPLTPEQEKEWLSKGWTPALSR